MKKMFLVICIFLTVTACGKKLHNNAKTITAVRVVQIGDIDGIMISIKDEAIFPKSLSVINNEIFDENHNKIEHGSLLFTIVNLRRLLLNCQHNLSNSCISQNVPYANFIKNQESMIKLPQTINNSDKVVIIFPSNIINIKSGDIISSTGSIPEWQDDAGDIHVCSQPKSGEEFNYYNNNIPLMRIIPIDNNNSISNLSACDESGDFNLSELYREDADSINKSNMSQKDKKQQLIAAKQPLDLYDQAESFLFNKGLDNSSRKR
ncbi:MAG: hypothetical protein ORN24_02145 [Burkholderiales bacterium]|nr:hypothetical protein [Burkholderiales bacterium]